MRFSLFSTLAVITLLLSGCGESEHEKVIKRLLGSLEDLNTTLDGVSDNASAQAALPKIKEIAADMKKIKEEMDALGDPSKSHDEALEKKYDAKLKEQMARMESNVQRIMAKDAQAAMTIGLALQGIQ